LYLSEIEAWISHNTICVGHLAKKGCWAHTISFTPPLFYCNACTKARKVSGHVFVLIKVITKLPNSSDYPFGICKLFLIKMENIKYHTIGTIAKSNINIVGRGNMYL
jgi:hypothetical protein